MNISQKTLNALHKLDKTDNGVSYKEIKTLDTNKDGKLDIKEASKAGITNQNDINEINGKVLKGFKTGEKQSNILNTLTEVVDSNSYSVDSTLQIVQKYSKEINKSAKEYNVNPLLLAGILFDEINHKDISDDITDKLGISNNIGLGQVSLGELRKQGFFTKYGYSPETEKTKPLPSKLNNIGREYLSHPENNIKTLAKQIKRNLKELGYSNNKGLSFNNYFDAHAMAKASDLHNGKYDYAQKIFEYIKNPELSKALKGEYKSPNTYNPVLEPYLPMMF